MCIPTHFARAKSAGIKKSHGIKVCSSLAARPPVTVAGIGAHLAATAFVPASLKILALFGRGGFSFASHDLCRATHPAGPLRTPEQNFFKDSIFPQQIVAALHRMTEVIRRKTTTPTGGQLTYSPVQDRKK